MKRLAPLLLLPFLFIASPIRADINEPVLQSTQNMPPNPNTDNMGSSLDDLIKYFLNLGLYLGFDLKKDAPAINLDPLTRTVFLQLKEAKDFNTLLINSFFSARSINSIIPQFLPDEGEGQTLNKLANTTYKTVPYTTPDPAKITVNEAIDQNNYQEDPVSQSISNILSLVDPKFCDQNLDPSKLKNCKLLYQNKVLSSVVGELPLATAATEDAFYGPTYVQALLGQLNSNSLLGPLEYSTTKATNTSDKKVGLTANTQAAQAENFIRYASGLLQSFNPISYKDYDDLFIAADFGDESKLRDTVSLDKKARARETLNKYFASLRTYSAQTSVGLGNLYSILSKRMAQTSDKKASSQAYEEYKMATRRLTVEKPPEGGEGGGGESSTPAKPSWLDQLNEASNTTVQKEIALLLAEINYQLYLSRQQEERLLMTQSVLLLLNLKAPNGNLQSKLSSQ